VEIRDTGVGIPKEDLERIFDRFFRGDAAKEEGGGSGLGLSITKDILRLHGCMIRADSDPGKGSTFSFTLPLEGRPKGERHTRTQSAPREET
jgi:signal transduction histidine kinase